MIFGFYFKSSETVVKDFKDFSHSSLIPFFQCLKRNSYTEDEKCYLYL